MTKRTMLTVAALLVSASPAFAEPVTLTASQLDRITAGFLATSGPQPAHHNAAYTDQRSAPAASRMPNSGQSFGPSLSPRGSNEGGISYGVNNGPGHV